MIKNLHFIVFYFFLNATVVFGQEINVTGTVSDAETGEPIPGVNIRVKGTSSGTATDFQGQYSVSVTASDVLIFSFVGYNTQELTVNNQTSINVSLETDVTQLQEIVVIGYGVQSKDDATGAVTAIGPENFNKGAITSPQELLMGRTSGVQITTNSGAPGSGATIRIRGGSSLSASNDPLIVIDGVPLDNEGISGMRNPLSAINPNDIETFTILKDASATAIYGSRASNGVIIITTKRGQSGKPQFSYSGNLSYNSVASKLDVMTGDEYRAMITERVNDPDITNPPASALDLLGTANTNWQNEVFGTAIGTDHNISMSGSAGNLPYRASIGYTSQKGILKTSSFDRTSLSVGIDPSLLDDQLKIKLNLKGMLAQNQFANWGAIGAAATFDPTQPVYDAESPFGGYYYWEQPGNPGAPITIAPSNPLALLELDDNQAGVNRIISNAEVEYKLPFLPNLTAKLNIGTDRSSSDGQQLVSELATWTYDPVNGNGTDNQYTERKSNDILEYYMNFAKDLDGINSRLDLMAGYSWQHFYREGTSLITNAAGDYTRQDTEFKTENYLVSFFGRLNYALMDKYLLTFTLRDDGSSRFAEENRWGLFPSAALAWKVGEESFLQNSDQVSEFKIRLGYGVTGQQNIGQVDYPALARVSYSEDNARYQFGNDYYTAIRYEAYDSQLKWEETTTLNAGVDLGFLDDRITASIDIYQRTTDDLLNVVPVPIGTNFTNLLLTNVGSLENRGMEFMVDAYAIDNEKMRWELGYNLTLNKNEITKLILTDDPDYLGVFTGGISGGVGSTIQVHSVGHPASSFFVYDQVNDENGMPIEGLYIDQNEDGIINDEDRIRHEKSAPDAYMGFSSRLFYGDFDFSFNARMNVGNYVYNNVASQYAQYQNMYNSVGYTNNLVSAVTASGFEGPQYYSRFYLSDASFFRMDNISLGYDMGSLTGDKLDLGLRFTVQNAFVITKYEGLDPEIADGIDNNLYPRPRTFLLGVNVNF